MHSAEPEEVLEATTRHYLTSGDFNGWPVHSIRGDDATKRAVLRSLVEREVLSLNFGDRHPNPHIQAFPPQAVSDQIAKLDTVDLEHTCAYPTKSHLNTIVRPEDYEGQPYRHSLALGAPQLECRFFDLKVLEHYRNDPRYAYQTDGIQGSLGVRDKYFESSEMREHDQVLLQQFGFGYDSEITVRVVAVLLCDLARLTPEHQQIWKANELTGDYFPHPDFWSAVHGHWPERVSVFRAFVEELRQINTMARLMGRPPLFRQDFSAAAVPREFDFLIRPTLAEFNAFALLLDKLLSDNIDLAFFNGEIDMEILEPRGDGVMVARNKGTIAALDEWLESVVRFPDPTDKKKMVEAFKRVRKLRQKPAHAINENDFDQKYFRDQRELIVEAYTAVRTLRLILANHPSAKGHKVPDWLYKGEIWTW